MRIAVLGGGFTGLSASYSLLKKGHEVFLFEKEKDLGGLAVGFANPKWSWTIEKAYHHWFTNDYFALNLANEIGHKVILKRPITKTLIGNKLFQIDSPISLLLLPKLSLIDKLRMGIGISYLKLVGDYSRLNGQKATEWIRKTMGKKAFDLIWEPLFMGKFGEHRNNVSLIWFWARIKKRTSSLCYPEGGFKSLVDNLSQNIKDLGGKVILDSKIIYIKSNKKIALLKLTKSY